MSISSSQCRAARGLLNLSQSQVARAAHIAPPTLSQFERADKAPSYNNLQAIIAVLETHGIVFIPANGGGPGVKLKASQDATGSKAPGPDAALLDASLCRAARDLLDLSQQELADKAGMGRSTVAEFEREGRSTSARKLRAMRDALEAAGAVFLAPDSGSGPGVRLRDRPPSENG